MRAKPWTLTTDEAAFMAGLSTQRIAQLREEGLPCQSAPGPGRAGVKFTYPADEFFAWFINRARKESQERAATQAGVADVLESEARKKAADAEMAEVKLAERRRELLTISDYRDGMARMIVGAKAQLMAIAPRLRAQVGPEVAGKVDTEIRATLETLGREAGGVPQPS